MNDIGEGRHVASGLVIANVFLQSELITKYSTKPVNGSARPNQLNSFPPFKGFSSPNTKHHGGTCWTQYILSPVKYIVIGKFVNGNSVEFLHASFEREGGAGPFTIGEWCSLAE
jgi:hypothetical protein